MKTAILVDGGFYRRRAQSLWGDKTAEERAKELHKYCLSHLTKSKKKSYSIESELYRIFYYDCPPSNKKIYHPLLKKQIDLSKSELFTWSNEFYKQLSSKRKLALRMGELAESQAYYSFTLDATKKLINGKITLDEITERDLVLHMEQKGVDMRIGLDIASIAFKKQAEQIILISGDSDFVPAAKLARREGIDFILDPMWASIKDNLNEHVDGIVTKTPKPGRIQI